MLNRLDFIEFKCAVIDIASELNLRAGNEEKDATTIFNNVEINFESEDLKLLLEDIILCLVENESEGNLAILAR